MQLEHVLQPVFAAFLYLPGSHVTQVVVETTYELSGHCSHCRLYKAVQALVSFHPALQGEMQLSQLACVFTLSLYFPAAHWTHCLSLL